MAVFETYGNGSCTVRVRAGLLSGIGRELTGGNGGRRLVILTEKKVFSLHGAVLTESLTAAGFSPLVLTVAGTEAGKDLSTLTAVLEFLEEHDLSRSDILLCFGGGVISDVGLLAASLYKRGMRCVVCPTTLLAQIDASIGGKCGVNLNGQKNHVGLFRSPDAVLTDTNLLSTLPPEEFASGMAEMIKYAVLFDRPLFEELAAGDLSADSPDLESAVARCIGHKIRVCESDPTDDGERRLLNFGHTLGHALEERTVAADRTLEERTVASDRTLEERTVVAGRSPMRHGFAVAAGRPPMRHGFAVAAGMAEMARVSVRHGLASPDLPEALCALLRKYGLPTELPCPMSELLPFLSRDKKVLDRGITLIVPTAVGACELRTMPLSDAANFLTASPTDAEGRPAVCQAGGEGYPITCQAGGEGRPAFSES